MRILHRLRQLLSGTDVRPMGKDAVMVALGERRYWVRAKRGPGRPPVWHVFASDVRDMTTAATVISSPPAPAHVVPEVRRRIREHFARSGAQVTFH